MEASVRLLGTSLRAARTSPAFRQTRAFALSSRRLQDAPSPSPSSSSDFPSTSPSSRSTVSDSISSLLDESLDLNKGPHATRTSRFPNRNPPTTNAGSRITDFAKSMTAPARSRPAQSSTAAAVLDFDPFLTPSRNDGPPSGISAESQLPLVKLSPTTGRTIKVDQNRGMDVGKAFRTLEISCARNSVRRDFQRQRFHERPGLKRKRLKSERWRKNFKAGFKETVEMVLRMKRQGW